jgi:multisubunit Na+/H+ antiporter MnhG subunit
MGLDIRLPIGLLFSVIGLLLAGFGFFSNKAIYQRSLGLNVNLAWGAVLLVFGAVMLILGRRLSAIRPDAASFAAGIDRAEGERR